MVRAMEDSFVSYVSNGNELGDEKHWWCNAQGEFELSVNRYMNDQLFDTSRWTRERLSLHCAYGESTLARLLTNDEQEQLLEGREPFWVERLESCIDASESTRQKLVRHPFGPAVIPGYNCYHYRVSNQSDYSVSVHYLQVYNDEAAWHKSILNLVGNPNGIEILSADIAVDKRCPTLCKYEPMLRTSVNLTVGGELTCGGQLIGRLPETQVGGNFRAEEYLASVVLGGEQVPAFEFVEGWNSDFLRPVWDVIRSSRKFSCGLFTLLSFL